MRISDVLAMPADIGSFAIMTIASRKATIFEKVVAMLDPELHSVMPMNTSRLVDLLEYEMKAATPDDDTGKITGGIFAVYFSDANDRRAVGIGVVTLGHGPRRDMITFYPVDEGAATAFRQSLRRLLFENMHPVKYLDPNTDLPALDLIGTEWAVKPDGTVRPAHLGHVMALEENTDSVTCATGVEIMSSPDAIYFRTARSGTWGPLQIADRETCVAGLLLHLAQMKPSRYRNVVLSLGPNRSPQALLYWHTPAHPGEEAGARFTRFDSQGTPITPKSEAERENAAGQKGIEGFRRYATQVIHDVFEVPLENQ